jgi:transcription initiation factor IIE alpha subunit
MIPGPEPQTMVHRIANETLSAALSPLSMRSVQARLERLLIDDRELLISLQCQLEQIRRELRLLNDERILRVLDSEGPLRH